MNREASLRLQAPLQEFPTWAIIVATTLALYAGLAIAAHIIPDAATHQRSLSTLPSPARFLAIGIPIYVAEALFFIVVPIELAVRFARMPLLGVAVGVLGYGVFYHWSHGLLGIILASWMALVLGTSYIVLRGRSRETAILSTLGQKIAFLLLAGLGVYLLKPA